MKRVNESTVWRNRPISMDDCVAVLKKLEEIVFVNRDLNGFYEILPGAADALSEFFGFVWRPRGGKTGFLRYLTQSEKRVMLWYCLYRKCPLSSQEASQLTGHSRDKCNKYLKRFVKQGLLARFKGKYKVADEEKIFEELLLGYETFCMAKPTLRDMILEVMKVHEEMFGKEIYEHLKDLGIRCDSSTVYKHLKNLEKHKLIRKTGKVRKVRGTYAEYYALNYDIEKYKEQVLSEIKEIMDRFKVKIRNEFFIEAQKQKPHELDIFLKELPWLILQDEHQIASFALWIPFIKELPLNTIRKIISEISLAVSDEELVEKLEKISRTHKISPLAISILYLSKMAIDVMQQPA